jgi:alkyl sulfatase BDS1-like metallo-beta-lactamase superfamily hydrolase
LSTVRGDRLRSAKEYIRCVDRVIALGPETLITGHNVPITGEDTIKKALTQLRDGAAYVHDETVRGMNEGKDIHTLMREITLPPELDVGPNRGPLSWSVRAVWEEYSGWFRFESTTELYGVPQRTVWPQLVEMAGGADALAHQAELHASAGRPLEALHLTDMVLTLEPTHQQALAAKLRSLEQLVERTGGRTFDELRWLETEIAQTEAGLALGEPTQTRASVDGGARA